MDLSYYDEEIIVDDALKLQTLSSRNRREETKRIPLNTKLISSNLSSDDDGLLQDIADDDDDIANDDDDDDEEETLSNKNLQAKEHPVSSNNAKSLLNSTRTSLANYMDGSKSKGFQNTKEDVHEDDLLPPREVKRSVISVEKWEKLAAPQDIKDLFPYILKYIPQSIDITYHLEPFIPDYIPAVGDVDAFLKVTQPQPIPGIGDAVKIERHLQHLGLTVLDEPSEDQSEPSLLTMKLRSTMSGGGMVSSRVSSASMGPVAKATRDIDKWILEIENVHSTQLFLDLQMHKDIDEFLENWPSSPDLRRLQETHERCLGGQCDLMEYLRIILQEFGMADETLKTHADYLINIRTLISLYLIINQI